MHGTFGVFAGVFLQVRRKIALLQTKPKIEKYEDN